MNHATAQARNPSAAGSNPSLSATPEPIAKDAQGARRFEITARPAGGFRLRLFDAGQEVGGGIFDDDTAALSEGDSWLGGHEQPADDLAIDGNREDLFTAATTLREIGDLLAVVQHESLSPHQRESLISLGQYVAADAGREWMKLVHEQDGTPYDKDSGNATGPKGSARRLAPETSAPSTGRGKFSTSATSPPASPAPTYAETRDKRRIEASPHEGETWLLKLYENGRLHSSTVHRCEGVALSAGDDWLHGGANERRCWEKIEEGKLRERLQLPQAPLNPATELAALVAWDFQEERFKFRPSGITRSAASLEVELHALAIVEYLRTEDANGSDLLAAAFDRSGTLAQRSMAAGLRDLLGNLLEWGAAAMDAQLFADHRTVLALETLDSLAADRARVNS